MTHTRHTWRTTVTPGRVPEHLDDGRIAYGTLPKGTDPALPGYVRDGE